MAQGTVGIQNAIRAFVSVAFGQEFLVNRAQPKAVLRVHRGENFILGHRAEPGLPVPQAVKLQRPDRVARAQIHIEAADAGDGLRQREAGLVFSQRLFRFQAADRPGAQVGDRLQEVEIPGAPRLWAITL